LRRVGVHDQKSVPKTGQRPQFYCVLSCRQGFLELSLQEAWTESP